MNTISRLCHQHIGQVKESEAQQEIDRLEKQSGNKWRTDKSDFLFCPDETDEYVHNPCERIEGYVFVVRDFSN